MSYLFRHSTVGTLIHYATKGKLDFTRKPGKSISSSSSTDDVPATMNVEDATLGAELKQHQTSLVDWSGPDDPSMPINWPLSQKITMTFIIAFCKCYCIAYV
jgi:DHA1 family multidrug resistance protein-like MFS transporter